MNNNFNNQKQTQKKKNRKQTLNKFSRNAEKMLYQGVADAVPFLTDKMVAQIGSGVKQQAKRIYNNAARNRKQRMDDSDEHKTTDSSCINISARVLATIKALTMLALKGNMSNIGVPLCLYSGSANRPVNVNKIFRFVSFSKDTFASQADKTFAILLRPATSMSNSSDSFFVSTTTTTMSSSNIAVGNLQEGQLDSPYDSAFFNSSSHNDATAAFPYAYVIRIKLNSIQSNQGGQCVGVITSDDTSLEGAGLGTLLTNYVQSRSLILDNDWVYMIKYGNTSGPETAPGNATYAIAGFIGTTTQASQPMSYEVYVLQAVTGSGVMSQSEPYVPDISSDVMFQSIFTQNQELAFGNVSTNDLDSLQETFCKYFARTSSVGLLY